MKSQEKNGDFLTQKVGIGNNELLAAADGLFKEVPTEN